MANWIISTFLKKTILVLCQGISQTSVRGTAAKKIIVSPSEVFTREVLVSPGAS